MAGTGLKQPLLNKGNRVESVIVGGDFHLNDCAVQTQLHAIRVQRCAAVADDRREAHLRVGVLGIRFRRGGNHLRSVRRGLLHLEQ